MRASPVKSTFLLAGQRCSGWVGGGARGQRTRCRSARLHPPCTCTAPHLPSASTRFSRSAFMPRRSPSCRWLTSELMLHTSFSCSPASCLGVEGWRRERAGGHTAAAASGATCSGRSLPSSLLCTAPCLLPAPAQRVPQSRPRPRSPSGACAGARQTAFGSLGRRWGRPATMPGRVGEWSGEAPSAGVCTRVERLPPTAAPHGSICQRRRKRRRKHCRRRCRPAVCARPRAVELTLSLPRREARMEVQHSSASCCM